MNTSPIKFAIAGCGHIGKRHAEMVKRNPEAELVAVIDSDKNKQQELTNKSNNILQCVNYLGKFYQTQTKSNTHEVNIEV